MRLTILETPAITIWCHVELRLIHHQMHRACGDVIFREALSVGAVAMKKHGADKWLSDDRKNVALSPADERWVIESWFPTALAAGWRYWALVRPVPVVGRTNAERFAKTYADLGLTARMFSEVEPAFRWLESPLDAPEP